MNSFIYSVTLLAVYFACDKYWPGPKWRSFTVGFFASVLIGGVSGYYTSKSNTDECLKDAECALKEVENFSPQFKVLMEGNPELKATYILHYNTEIAKPNPNFYKIGVTFFNQTVSPVIRQASAATLFPMLKEEQRFVDSVCNSDIDWANSYFLGVSADISKLSPESRVLFEKYLELKNAAYVEGKTQSPYVLPSKKEEQRLAMEVFVNNPQVKFTADELINMDFAGKSPTQNCINMRKVYKAMVSIKPADAVEYYKLIVLE